METCAACHRSFESLREAVANPCPKDVYGVHLFSLGQLRRLEAANATVKD